ncbi:hypothetical protein U14_04712 [Candidatus Moduliflexus flocculans]|uniref:Uncharacterized protein n=1 Tax=Candidatus Moduliflexus flocculans TaxID=1499966 RepID=A0A0S6W102_9BACT|nr:hypothetical protein U14_04712 [Candidatus Moduliflexus flocculans]
MTRHSQNDDAWQRVFDEPSLGLLAALERDGFASVSAEQLKQIGRREPRLMAKFDTSSERPNIFKRHALTIFPIENGRYVIFPDQRQTSYFRVQDELAALLPERYRSETFLPRFDSYPRNQHFSETQAIDFAYISKLLQTFVEDDALLLTLRGRLRSGDFAFTLPDGRAQVQVSGVQIEIDSGYESDRAIYLIEAKIGKRDDFHIRQLLYPYLEWSRRSRKAVVPILLIYSNGVYYFFQFEFQQRFGEMRVVKKRCYALEDAPRLHVHLANWLRRIPAEDEPKFPVPQADDLDTVVETTHAVADGKTSKTEIAESFEFDERQGDYYANAAAYLGLLERQQHGFVLSEAGARFVGMASRNERSAYVLECLLKRPIFHDLLGQLCAKSTESLFAAPLSPDDVPPQEIVRIILRHRPPLNETTANRRVATIRSWIRWVFKNCDVI